MKPNSPNQRKELRAALDAPLRLSWADPALGSVFLRGRCLDVSARGLRVLVSDPVPKFTTVSVAITGIHLSGGASVRHVARSGRGYVLGLLWSQPMPPSVMAKYLNQANSQVGIAASAS